ncbi:MAG: hypothetical protein ACRDHO_12615 [Actinomycetota bacterium]
MASYSGEPGDCGLSDEFLALAALREWDLKQLSRYLVNLALHQILNVIRRCVTQHRRDCSAEAFAALVQ